MTDVTIPALPAGVTLTGTEPLETVQANVSVKVPSRYFGLATDPVLLVGADAALTQSRTITAGAGISLVDSGAGGTLTVNSTGIVASTAEFVLLSPEAALPDSRTLTGTANQVIITDNGAGSTVVLSLPQNIATTSSPTFASLTLTNPLTVPNGGSGASTLTGLLQGNGAAAFTAITNSSTVGQVLRVTGAATYAWGALDLADSDAVTGLLPVANGGSGIGTLSGILQGNGTAAFSAIANSSTVGQVLRVTGASTYAWGALDLADADAVTGALPITNGGTGQTSASAAFDALSPMTTLGDTIYGGASGTGTRLAGNTTTTLMVLSQTGTGAVSAAPAWTALFANPTASVGLAAVNGVATTAMRSDAAPALDQSIAPTWTGAHIFTNAAGIEIENTLPILHLDETDAAADERNWLVRGSTGILAFSTASDAAPTTAVENALIIDRTGTAVTTATFGGTQFQFPNGSAGTPAIGGSTDTDTGIFWTGGNELAFSTSGTLRLDIRSADILVRVPFGAADGAVGGPSYSFENDADTGMYRDAANQLSFSAGNTRVFTALSTFLQVDLPARFADGAIGAPSITFGNDTDTGLWRNTSDAINFSCGGGLALQLSSSLFSLQVGVTTVQFAGIGTTASAANAFLDSGAGNQLLRSTSSIQYKRDVVDLDADVERLLDLRPVAYRSKCEHDDPDQIHFGLIAEEVAEVFPQLVHRDESGQVQSVQYDRVVPLILAYLKKQNAARASH
jgi:hypothetical protein